MEKLLTAYKFYDDRDRRLSIFAKVKPYGLIGEFATLEDLKNMKADRAELQIVVFTCNKQDKFTKKVAKTLYKMYIGEGAYWEDGVCSPQVFGIHCALKDVQNEFISWCMNKYRKLHEETFHIKGDVVNISTSASKFGQQLGRNVKNLKVTTLW